VLRQHHRAARHQRVQDRHLSPLFPSSPPLPRWRPLPCGLGGGRKREKTLEKRREGADRLGSAGPRRRRRTRRAGCLCLQLPIGCGVGTGREACLIAGGARPARACTGE
jgi:hypothetical protein